MTSHATLLRNWMYSYEFDARIRHVLSICSVFGSYHVSIKGSHNIYELYGTGSCAKGHKPFLHLKQDIDFLGVFNYGTGFSFSKIIFG